MSGKSLQIGNLDLIFRFFEMQINSVLQLSENWTNNPLQWRRTNGIPDLIVVNLQEFLLITLNSCSTPLNYVTYFEICSDFQTLLPSSTYGFVSMKSNKISYRLWKHFFLRQIKFPFCNGKEKENLMQFLLDMTEGEKTFLSNFSFFCFP